MTRDEWERTSYDLADAIEDCFSPQAMKIIRNFIEVAADDFDKPRRAERGGGHLSSDPTLPLFPEAIEH